MRCQILDMRKLVTVHPLKKCFTWAYKPFSRGIFPGISQEIVKKASEIVLNASLLAIKAVFRG